MRNPRFQTPKPKEAPSRKFRTGAARRVLSLVLGVSLHLGIWDWGFPLHAASISLTITEPTGIARQSAPVTSGVPFPMGALKTNDALQLLDATGTPVPLQHRTTSTWRDGSVKWALLDFQANMAASEVKQLTLNWGSTVRQAETAGVRIDETPSTITINTGPLKFSVSKQRFGIFDDRLQQSLKLAKEFSNVVTRVLPPGEVVVEESGPLRAVVKVSGWFDDGGTNRLVQYLLRVHVFAGSSDVIVEHTAIQMNPKIKMLWVKDLSLTLSANLGGAAFAIDGSTTHTGSLANAAVTLTQLKESSYSLAVNGVPTFTNGLRARGWFEAGDVFVGVQDFWPQFPKAVTLATNGIRIGLYPHEEIEPFDMDQGLGKTHRLLISLRGARTVTSATASERADLMVRAPEEKFRAFEQPLFAQAPIEWYCDSKVFGEVAPFNFDLFPDYETLTEASGDKFIKSMATGIRNWGDVYYGGPYKGKNSYMNLEYDVPHNFLVQFARTGQRKYLDAARRMAQHQADIDVNHFTKWQWKHSPRHTEIQAEFGHTFTRGLLENYFLTGNRRCFEAAVELGDFFTKQIRNPRETGNERQIGWGLISLLPVYEATWDKKYLAAATETVDRLVAGQDAKGKFDIRWDNRIAFFNGIAATGFIYYERATGDQRAADAALKTIRRTKGFYPEYAGRTLEALAWAYQRTSDPEYLDLLKLTYETTMAKQIAWNTMELGAPTIFTVHTLPFLEKSGLVTKPREPLNLTASQFASENGMFAHHIPAGSGELFLRIDSPEPFRLAIIRKGAWKADASAEFFDPSGRSIKRWPLAREPQIWQREVLEVKPNTRGTHRLALRSATIQNVHSGSYVTWDIATSRAIPTVMQTPEFTGLQFITPHLFTMPRGDTDRIELELAGEGEGFKKAVVYDPDGNVAATTEAFVDLGDTGRYTYKLAAQIPPKHRQGIWSISLQNLSITKLSGLAPYFSTSKRAFFQPDRN